jgi:predicted kinase
MKMKKQATFNILVGVAGAGKSTAVNKIKEGWFRSGYMLICPDQLREDLCGGNRSDQSRNAEVWKLAYEQAEYGASQGLDVIFDSTMLSPKKRKRLIEIGRAAGARVVAHVVERDLDTILRQNASRKWVVPEHIVKNMFDSYVRPTEDEGFDKIILY